MSLIKLHLGCGKRFLPGFVHVDRADFPHIDYNHDVQSLPFIESDSAELVYASHVLEYFDLEEVRKVLTEWNRVLCSGGILRLAVPDFEALVKVYQRDRDLSKILGPLYGRMKVESPSGEGAWIYHRTVYDFISLKGLLEESGFENIRRYDWKQTIHSDVDDHSQAYIPHMEKDTGLLISLNVEGGKV